MQRDVSTVGFLSHVQKDLAVAARRQAATASSPAALSPGTFREYSPAAPRHHRRGRRWLRGGGWKRLSSERLMETPYFSLRSDRLRLPDGGIKDPYYVIERPDAAIIVPLTAGGEVVLVNQYRPPLETMELGLPEAGLVEGTRDRRKRPAASSRRKQATRAASGNN